MRLRSTAKKAAETSVPPHPDPPPLLSQPQASTNTKKKAAPKALVKGSADAPADALVNSPGWPPRVPLRPLAMAPPKPLPEAPSIPPFVYHSAYSGSFITNTDGSFNNFVCEPDQSHQLFGYWRFGSEDDERRAHVRGFSKPEDVLIAQDRSDGSYDGIFLRWVCGSKDPNLGTLLFGSAVEHLKTIYEIRHILGRPMSLRGRLPVYPMSDDARVKHYLTKKFFIEEPKELNDSISGQQIPRVDNSTLRLLVPPGTDHDRLATVRSEIRTPGYSSRHYIRATPASNHPATLPLRAVSPLAPPKAQESGDATSAAGFESLPPRGAGSNIGRTTIYSLSRYSESRPGSAFSPPASPSEGNTRMAPQFQATPSFRFSPSDTNSSLQATSNGSEYVSPYLVSQANTAQRSTSTVNPPYSPPSDSRPSSPLKAPPLSMNVLPGRTQVGALTEFVRDVSKCSSVRPASVQPQPIYDITTEDPRSINNQQHIGTGSITSRISKITTDLQGLPSTQERKDFDVEHEDVLSDEEVPHYALDMDNEQLSSPTQATSEAKGWLEDVPCIDCGLDVGHKSGCHIGNLKPIGNLTVLDHRSLADAVERFDPGPWTTHFNQYAEQAPDDPAVQIQGIAEVIRNEDSYKNDPELHHLPDDLMILTWAFKISSEIEVIKE